MTAWDIAGRLESITTESSHPTTYDYDDLDRLILTTRPDYITSSDPGYVVLHDFTWANTTGDLRLMEIESTNSRSTVLSTQQYQYDNSGHLTSWTQPQAGEDWDLRYDTVGRLDQVKTGANNRFNYAWDLHNNLTCLQVNTTSTQTFTYDAGDKLTSRTNPTASFTYDAAGNTTGDGTNTYQWDYAGNLKKITHPTGSTEFSYDGLRRRVRILEKNAGGATLSDHRYLWCGAKICQKRTGTTGGTGAKVYYPHGVVDGGTTYYYTFDHLGWL